MTNITWLHDKALHCTPLGPQGMQHRAIFVWDDDYFQQRDYTLKRLVFIYETLCAMPVEILPGDTVEVLLNLAPQRLYTQHTCDSIIKHMTSRLAEQIDLRLVTPPPFAYVPAQPVHKRFFKYWNKAKKTAFTPGDA